MNNFEQRVRALDDKYNDLPRKVFLVAAVLFTGFIMLRLLPYLWPFIFGLLFAAIMCPLVNWFSKRFRKAKSPRKIASLIAMVVVYGVIIGLLLILFRQLFKEVQKLANNIPGMLDWVEHTLDGWLATINTALGDGEMTEQQRVLREQLDQFSASIANTIQSFVSTATPAVASGAWSTFINIPHVILFVVMTIMSSFYFASDGKRIRAFLNAFLPEGVLKRADSLKESIGHAVVQQIKAQVLISLAIMVALIIGFFVLRIDYALLLGSVIGLMDVLPIVGAGTVLIPWGLFNLFAGNFLLAVKLVGMYLMVVVIRQVIEPRIVAGKLGLYPLVTMLSMYMGLKLMGFIGLIIGPLVANICKVVLVGDAAIRKQQRQADILKK